MTGYAALLDADMRAFVRRSEEICPSDSFGSSIADYRSRYDALCAAFRHPYPAGLSVADERLGGVPARRYRPRPVKSRGRILYAHGGSFCLGGLDSHDDICADLAAGAGAELVAVDYRLLPEHRLVDALDDVNTVFEALHMQEPDRPLVLAGDSAGAFLCASVAMANRTHPALAGLVLIYPGLGGRNDASGSRKTHAHAPLLTLEEVRGLDGVLGAGAKVGDYPVPLRQTDFSGLPPVFAQSAECDPLADDARDFAASVRAAGGAATWDEATGTVHGHLRARRTAKKAAEAFARVVEAVSALVAS